jgi:50S ribosomal subunit-associated GTPase HflX
VIAAVIRKGADPAIVEEHLDELEMLLDTAGADAVQRLTQERERPDISTALGKGKVEELKELVESSNATSVVFMPERSKLVRRSNSPSWSTFFPVLHECGHTFRSSSAG